MNWDKVRNENKYQQGSKTKLARDKPLGVSTAKSEGPCIACKKKIKVGQKIVMYNLGKAIHRDCL